MSTHKKVTRIAGLLVIASLALAACSSSGASTAPSAAGSSAASTAPSAAASASGSAAVTAMSETATTAEDVGGMDALFAAGKAEGTLNVIALPPDWANYGQIIKDFATKYGIKVESDQPDVDSQVEIDAVNNLAGTDAAPDVFDLAPTVALANTACSRRTRSRPGPTSRRTSRRRPASGSATTPASCPSAATSKVALPATVADLLKPEYEGMVALNGNPTTAGAGFNGVVMASLANGGSADDIAPGVEFFKQLNEAGNLLPVDPTPATIASGQTPCVIDWEYNNAAQTATLSPRASTGRSSSRATPRRSPRTTSRPSTRTRRIRRPPACWEEFLYTPEAQNTWLKGFARPVLQGR